MQILRSVISIAGAAQNSGEYNDARTLGSFAGMTIIGPAALTGVCKVAISDVAGGTFRTLQSPPGTDVAIAAGKAVVLPPFGAVSMRIESAAPEGAQRDFVVLAQSYK